jgi:hypothetical protein
MRTLHMLHPLEVGVSELTSTVRNGFKWADLKDGEEIELCVCTRDPETHSVEGIGVVNNLWFGRFEDVPSRLISNEHEISSRTYKGLFTSMRKAYGSSFDEDSPVTVIEYWRAS